MDYIREELLRQKKLLTVLMTGKNREQTEEYDPARETEFSWQTSQENQTAVEIAAADDPVRLNRQFGSEQIASAKKGIDWREHTHRSGRSLRQEYRVEEMVGSVYIMPPRQAAVAGNADVRDMSRKIQRDARRYDGGFSIY